MLTRYTIALAAAMLTGCVAPAVDDLFAEPDAKQQSCSPGDYWNWCGAVMTCPESGRLPTCPATGAR